MNDKNNKDYKNGTDNKNDNNDEVKMHRPDTSKHAVTFTEAAILQIKKSIEKRGSGIGIRLAIETRGCSGLAYVLDYVDSANENDNVFPINHELSVYVDPESFTVIKGTKVDYVKEGLNEKFTFKNPKQSGACGCGESFTID